MPHLFSTEETRSFIALWAAGVPGQAPLTCWFQLSWLWMMHLRGDGKQGVPSQLFYLNKARICPIKKLKLYRFLSLFWSWKARDRHCSINSCVLRVHRGFWSASRMPAKSTILCSGIHKSLSPKSPSAVKHRFGGQERTDVKPYCKKRPNPRLSTH